MLSVASLAVVAEEPNIPLIVGLLVLCMACFSFANSDFVEGRKETQPTGHCLICHLVLDREQFATRLGLGFLAYRHDVVSGNLAFSLSPMCYFILS